MTMPRFLACNYVEERLREIANTVERLSIDLPHSLCQPYIEFNNAGSSSAYQRPWMKALPLFFYDIEASTEIDEVFPVPDFPCLASCANKLEASSFHIKASQPIALPEYFNTFDETIVMHQNNEEAHTGREVSMIQFEELVIVDPLLGFARNFPSIDQLHRRLKFKIALDPFDNRERLLSDFEKVKRSSVNIDEWHIDDCRSNTNFTCKNTGQNISVPPLKDIVGVNINIEKLEGHVSETSFADELTLETFYEPAIIKCLSEQHFVKDSLNNLTSFDIESFDINADLNDKNCQINSKLEPDRFSIANTIIEPHLEQVLFKDLLLNVASSYESKMIESPIVIIGETDHLLRISLENSSDSLTPFVIDIKCKECDLHCNTHEQLLAFLDESEFSVRGIVNYSKGTVNSTKELMTLPCYALCATNACKIETSNEEDSTSLPWDIVKGNSSISDVDLHQKLLKSTTTDWQISPSLRKRSARHSIENELFVKISKLKDLLDLEADSDFVTGEHNCNNRTKSTVLPLTEESSSRLNISNFDNLSNKIICEIYLSSKEPSLCQILSDEKLIKNPARPDLSDLSYSNKASDQSKITLCTEACVPVMNSVCMTVIEGSLPCVSLHQGYSEQINLNPVISKPFSSDSEVTACHRTPSLKANIVPILHDVNGTADGTHIMKKHPCNVALVDVKDTAKIASLMPSNISENKLKKSITSSSSMTASVVQQDYMLHRISGSLACTSTSEIRAKEPAASCTPVSVNGTMSNKIKLSKASTFHRAAQNIMREGMTDENIDPCERFFSLLQVAHPSVQTDFIQISTDSALTDQPYLQTPARSLKSVILTHVSGVNSVLNQKMDNCGVVNSISSRISAKVVLSDVKTSQIDNKMTVNTSDNGRFGTFHLITSGVFDETAVDVPDVMMSELSDDVAAVISDEVSDDIFNETTVVSFRNTNSSSLEIVTSSCTKNKSSVNVNNVDDYIQIIEVKLNKSYYELLSDVQQLSEPFLKLLRQQLMIGRQSTFESLSSDFTGFTLKQCFQDWQRNDGSLEVMQAALYVDTMVRVVECITGSSLSCALAWLGSRRQMSKRLSNEGLDSIETLLRDAESCQELVTHPKISEISIAIRRHLNESSEDCGVNIIIILKKNSQTLAQSMMNVISNIAGIHVCIASSPSVRESTDNVLTSHNCYILKENQLITSPLVSSATLVIEYEYSDQSQWPSFCKRLGKRFVGMKTGTIDWTTISSKANTVGKESCEMLAKCSVDIEELNEEQILIVIASVSVTRMKSILEVLESGHNIQVIERDYISIQERIHRDMGRRCLQFEDIAVDHRTCIVLQDTATLNHKDSLEVLVIKVAALQCKFQSCCVLLHSAWHPSSHDTHVNEINNKECVYNVDYISKLEGTLSLLETKLDDYHIKVVHCHSYETMGEMVRTIALNSVHDDPHMNERMIGEWIMGDPSKDEIWLLVNFSCLNSFSAQILLKYFSSREALMNNTELDLTHVCPQLSDRIISAFLKIKAEHILNTEESCNTKEKWFNAPINDGKYLGAAHRLKQLGNDVIKTTEIDICNREEPEGNVNNKHVQLETRKSQVVVDTNHYQSSEQDSSKVYNEFIHQYDTNHLKKCTSKEDCKQSWNEGNSYQLIANEIQGEYISQSQNNDDDYASCSVPTKQQNGLTYSNLSSSNKYSTNSDNESEVSKEKLDISISWSPNTHIDSDITDSDAGDSEEMQMKSSHVSSQISQEAASQSNSLVSSQVSQEAGSQSNSHVSSQISQEAVSQSNNEFLQSIIDRDRAQLLFKTNPDHLNSSQSDIRETGWGCAPLKHSSDFNEPCLGKLQDIGYQGLGDDNYRSDMMEKKRLNTAGWRVMSSGNVRDDLSHLNDTHSGLDPCDYYSERRPTSAGVNITSHRPDRSDISTATHTARSTDDNRTILNKDFQSLYDTINTSCSAQSVSASMQYNQVRYVDGSQRVSLKREVACVTPSVRVPVRALNLTTGSLTSQSSIELPTIGVKVQPITRVMSQPGVAHSTNNESVRCRNSLTTCGDTSTPVGVSGSFKSRKRTSAVPHWSAAESSENDKNKVNNNSNYNGCKINCRNETSGSNENYFNSRGHPEAHGWRVSEHDGRAEVQGIGLMKYPCKSSGMIKGPCKRSKLTFLRDSTLKGGQTRLTFL